MLDRVVRAALIVAHRLLRVWWFVRRPPIEGAAVVVRRRSSTPSAAGDSGEWEWLLVANSYKSGWTLPCGGIRSGEQPRSCARRELREEVGIAVPEARLEEKGQVLLEYYWRPDNVHFFELTLADDEAPEVRVDRREVVEARFVRLSEMNGLDLVPHLAEYIGRSGADAPLTAEPEST
jgi:8-oxo-dGTP pyrophosphatase MutT (NUDIX family)